MIIVDTGVLYALADRDDRHHSACVAWLREARGSLLVPATVIAEAGYLVGRLGGAKAEAAFLSSVGPRGRFMLVELVPDDLSRMRDLVIQYGDLQLGTTDASVVALAERLGVVEVATVDRRHFTVVRPRHTKALRLVPDGLGARHP